MHIWKSVSPPDFQFPVTEENKMKQHSSYVYFDEAVCTGCAFSVKACPTRAIRVRNGRPLIMDGKCIGCGECIRVCPTGAMKAVTSGSEPLQKDRISVALVSPVLYSQFFGVPPGDVLQALRQMGFCHAVDMSYFLEMFQCAAEEFIVRNRKDEKFPWPLISPVCPVVVRLIALQFPSLLSHILPIMRPVALMAREVNRQLIRKYGKEESVTLYYINPCPTRMDADRIAFHHERPYIDKTLGINEVYADLTRELKKIRKPAKPDMLDYGPTENSLIWGLSGGEILDMHLDRTLAVSGLKETIAYLEKIEMGLFQDIEYIEFRTCPEGCVGGTLIAIDKYLAKNTIKKASRKCGFKRRVSADNIHRLYEKGWFSAKSSLAKTACLFSIQEEPLSIEELMEIDNILERIHGMDCSACGAPDCRTFAEDVVRGEASLDDCVVLRARGKSAEKI
ncbi:4Fe-4S domain-containing protein [Desulfonema magnum]|uniref:4Fe-4S domain-containing protein n=2 Tax=Desulfonema magnum TaxID=45655 RepID=A0A975GP03_9BACT|nr:4Fe-4S domain-containing protein [Desulfonema magnum]